MRTVHQSGISVLGMALVLAGLLATPTAVNAEDQVHAIVPVPGPAKVETRRVIAAERALQSGDLGSVQEQVLADIVAAATVRDETTGYASVEATYAARLAQFRTVEWSLSDSLDLGSMQEQALAQRLAQFRALELSLSRSLGMGHLDMPSCEVVG